MSQIGKKCFYASFGLHFVLVVVVIFGSAFLTVRDKPEDAKQVKLYDPKRLSMLLQSGGSPLANAVPPTRAPAATPPPPVPEVVSHPAPRQPDEPVVKPTPEPPQPVKPKPPKPEHHAPKPRDVAQVKPNPTRHPVKPEPDSVKPEPKPVKPKEKELLADEDLTPVTRTTTQSPPKPIKKPKPERHPEETVRPPAPATPPGPDPVEVWEKGRREAIQTAMTSISRNSSAPITPVDIPLASGGDGGQEQTNYRDLVFSKYNAAWEPPAELEDTRASTMVSITIAPDGRVTERRIIRPSNNRLMDRSIQATLNKVTFIEPFPAGAGGHSRTYLINFNLQTKRSAG